MTDTDNILINRVAESDLQTVALDELVKDHSIHSFDLKDYLFRGLILREKDFREALKAFPWASLDGKYLAVHCSADAIIPMWAYLLISAYATPHAKAIYFGTVEVVEEALLRKMIETTDWTHLTGKRVVIKGCSDKELPASAYLTIANVLQPIVQSMMYGEPCSTVPIFKRPRVV